MLAQILVCEKLDKYLSFKTVDLMTKEEMVLRILDGEEYIEVENQTSRLKTVEQVHIREMTE